MSHTSHADALCQAIWVRRKSIRRPASQAALVRALIRAMGGCAGPQPDLATIAAELGVRHQTLYRALRALEARGVVVRSRATIEVRLEDAG